MSDINAPNLQSLQLIKVELENGYHEKTSTHTGVTTKIWVEEQKHHRDDGPAIIEIDHNDNTISEEWYLNGKLGRHDDGPTITAYDEGVKVEEIWQTGKIRHRKNGPAYIMTDSGTGEVRHESWYENGKLHRETGPAVIDYDGVVVTRESWYLDDKLHRENGPASIFRDAKTGDMKYQGWFINGSPHRDDGAAISSFFDGYYEEKYSKYKTNDGKSWGEVLESLNGGEPYFPENLNVWFEEYWVNGRLHREGSPSVMIYDKKTGKAYFEKWYNNGKLHRECGEAWIVRDINTLQVIEKKSYLKGRRA